MRRHARPDRGGPRRAVSRATTSAESRDVRREADREGKGRRVPLEVGDDLLFPGKRRPSRRETKSGEAVDGPRREEHERIPPGAPRGRDVGTRLDDDEVAALRRELAADGETGLARAADQDVLPVS